MGENWSGFNEVGTLVSEVLGVWGGEIGRRGLESTGRKIKSKNRKVDGLLLKT